LNDFYDITILIDFDSSLNPDFIDSNFFGFIQSQFTDSSFSLDNISFSNNSFILNLSSSDIDIDFFYSVESNIFNLASSFSRVELVSFSFYFSNLYLDCFGDQFGDLSLFDFFDIYDNSLFDSFLKKSFISFSSSFRSKLFSFDFSNIDIYDLLPHDQLSLTHDLSFDDIVFFDSSDLSSFLSVNGFFNSKIKYSTFSISLYDSFKFKNIDSSVSFHDFICKLDTFNFSELNDFSINSFFSSFS
jgi:hypothetical protein